MSKKVTKDARHYCFVFFNNVENATLNNEIAKWGPTTLGIFFDHRGQMPESSLHKRDTIGWRVDRLKHVHRDYARAAELMRVLTATQAQALNAWVGHRGTFPPDAKCRLYSREQIARYLDIDPASFDELICRALDRINEELDILIA